MCLFSIKTAPEEELVETCEEIEAVDITSASGTEDPGSNPSRV
jgi:hypothetical protein